MTNWKQDLVIACVLLVLAGTFGFLARDYPQAGNAFPKILCLLSGILALCLAGKSLWRMHLARHTSVRFIEWRYYRGVIMQAAIIAVFALIIPIVSYPVAGFLLCLATTLSGGYLNKRIALAFAAGVSFFVFVVFEIVLQVPLPAGIFFE